MVRFMNTRVTVKRLSDGKKLYGWVLESRKPGQIHINITKGDIQTAQELYELTLSSRLGAAVVTCVLGAVTDQSLLFAVPQVIEIIAPTTASRMAAPPYQVTISYDGKIAAGTLLDIANAGIGVRCSSEVPKDTVATIEIQAAFGRKSIIAVSAYSSQGAGMDPGWFRTGFRVDATSRLSQANWKYIFDFVVEQAILEAQHNAREGQGLGTLRRAA
jgi:hypothetical protein